MGTFLVFGSTVVAFCLGFRSRAASEVNVMLGWPTQRQRQRTIITSAASFFSIYILIFNSLWSLAGKCWTQQEGEYRPADLYTWSRVWLKYHWGASQRSDQTPTVGIHLFIDTLGCRGQPSVSKWDCGRTWITIFSICVSPVSHLHSLVMIPCWSHLKPPSWSHMAEMAELGNKQNVCNYRITTYLNI